MLVAVLVFLFLVHVFLLHVKGMEGFGAELGGVEGGVGEHGIGVLWVRGGADGGRRRRVLHLHSLPAFRCQGTRRRVDFVFGDGLFDMSFALLLTWHGRNRTGN